MTAPVSLTRFGLLAPPGASPRGDGRDDVLAQLRQPTTLPPGHGLPDLVEGLRLHRARAVEVAAARREQRRPDFVHQQEISAAEADFRVALAVNTRLPLHERLSLHWGNHFTIGTPLSTSYVAGDMDRTAIRPHMLGRFADMLRACTTHPAMLTYLGNDRSVGPNSPVGRRQRRGLNENLGRELLELHSLGVDGGYTQEDVVETAKILTGWTIPERGTNDAGIVFLADRHEPGARTVLGRRYPEGGEEQLLALVEDLARHPATARHVTRRLVRHFLGDGAPPDVAPALARVFQATEGDLRAVTEALVAHPASLSLPPAKLRPPMELVLSVARMMGGRPARPTLMNSLRALGQPWLGAPSPAGWPEEDQAWASPDAVKSRLDWALQLAGGRDPRFDAREVAEAVFGRWLSAETRRTLARAANGGQALALLVMSPEVQRR